MGSKVMIKNILKKLIQNLSLRRIVWSMPKKHGICVTFDDGPHIDNTPRILDILKRHDCKAVFFIIGELAEKNREIVNEIVAQGHQVGNHSYSHTPVKDLTLTGYLKDIKKCNKTLNEILGTSCRYIVRPPYGYLNPFATFWLLLSGYQIMMWTHDSNDSYVHSASELLEEVNKINLSSGNILLMHDDYSHTLEALDQILISIKS